MNIQQIAEFTAKTEELRNNLTNNAAISREERLRIRNEVIMNDLASGKAKEQIQLEWHLSRRRLDEIIQEYESNSEQWYLQLPQKYKQIMFNLNSNAVFSQILEMEKIMRGEKDPRISFEMRSKLAELRMKYDNMIAEGATYSAVKDLYEEMKNGAKT